MRPLAGPLGVRLALGQSSARWQLRLPQPLADALFPAQEAALAAAEAAEAEVLATDQEGAHMNPIPKPVYGLKQRVGAQ